MLSANCLKAAVANVVKDSQKGSDPDNTNKTTTIDSSSDAFRSLEEGATAQVVSILRNVYQKGHRDSIVFGISGLLFKSNVSLGSVSNWYAV
jgi:hypothetical protein